MRKLNGRLGRQTANPGRQAGGGNSAIRWTTALLHDQTKPPAWSEANLRLAVEAAGVALWSWNVEDPLLAYLSYRSQRVRAAFSCIWLRLLLLSNALNNPIKCRLLRCVSCDGF